MSSTPNTHDGTDHFNTGSDIFTIWQQNVNKSPTCQHDLISSATLAKRGIDLVALQEPAINNFGFTVAARDWMPIYPSTHGSNPHKTRSLFLIRCNILTDKWKQIDFPSGDVTVIQITGNRGNTIIYNIYNDCNKNDTVHQLEAFNHALNAEATSDSTEENIVIWLGDFNRHHPHWDDPTDTRLFTPAAINDAELLIGAVAGAGLDMALPPGISTHLHNVSKRWTRLDQVFISEDGLDSVITCDVLTDSPGINTDHLPILTTLDLSLARAPVTPPKNFRNVDWEAFEKEVETELDRLPQPTRIRTQGELDDTCLKLTEVLQKVINDKVPVKKLGVKSKLWWTKELTKLRQEANKTGRRASKYSNWPEHHSHRVHQDASKKYRQTMERTKRQHWRDWLEKSDDPDIWTAHKYISSPAGDGGKCRIPVLKLTRNGQEQSATTNDMKSEMLAKTFFPPCPSTDYPMHFVYPKPACKFDPITKDQVKQHLAKLKPYKAPGPDGIPNIVLSKCANVLVDRLYYVYNAILEKNIYYAPWKQSTTVVLRKPGKPRYDTPKAYRPIALLNTMSKVLTAIAADLMNFYTEKYKLLPAHHFGGRPGRTTTDAIHLLIHKIKDAWRKHQVTAVLFLDIEGAFPNAVTNKLLHSMRKRGLPEILIKFAGTMLKDRSTILRFDDYISDPIELDNGIGQGDPLSMALYQYYNADILDIPRESCESAEAYVDDAILTATAKTFEEAHKTLVDMMQRPGGMVDWSKSHNSSIEYSKLALIDFAHPGVKKLRPPLVLPDVTIEPSQNARYLGIILDQNLTWAPQLAQVIGKGSKWSAQIRRLTRPTWGLTPKCAKKLYTGVALPRILYGIDVWCTPLHGRHARGNRKGSVKAIKKLTSLQRLGALAITGGLRTTPTDTLDAHAALLPMDSRVEKVCFNAISRMVTLPAEHPLNALVKKSAKGRVKRHRSPLHTLTAIFGLDPPSFEKIPAVRAHPKDRGSPPARIDIPPDKDASKRADANATETIQVYSDGSAHSGQVGAAAILKREGKTDRVLKFHLGTTGQHTVYEAELVGMILGLHLIKTEKRNKTKCALNVDNQAALVAVKSEMNKSGHHLAAHVFDLAAKLKKSGRRGRFELTFRWTAGHVGIAGNEDADREAKLAAEGEQSGKEELPTCLRKQLGYSLSAVRQAHNEKLKLRWAAQWAQSPRYHRLNFEDTLTPFSQKFLKYISCEGISRQSASRIFQLRVGHVPLNQYLHRFKLIDSPCCPACGHPNETAEHFLLQCPKYAHERWPLLNQNRGSAPKLKKLLSSPKLITPLANYLEATGRFETNQRKGSVSGAY